MANRIIRSGLLDSEKINSLSDSEQIFFVRLMLIADDYGHCDGRPIYIRSNCFPVTEVPVEKVAKMLQALEKAGLIMFYVVDEKTYLEVINFGQRLRSMRYKVPCPQSAASGGNQPPESESESEVESESKEIDPDCLMVCNLLKKRILERRQQKITEETVNKWANTVRLMIEKDHRTLPEIGMLIDICHDMPPRANGFTWANNILSMEKLRQQWNEGKIYIGMESNNYGSRTQSKYGPQPLTKEAFQRQAEAIRDR